jgi:plastocyanin
LNSCDTETEKIIPKVHTVEIKQMKFQPAELIVQKGDTVVWINNDIVAHDVTEEPDKAWTSSVMPVGESWSLVVTQSADYYCSIHVVMKGKLVIQ